MEISCLTERGFELMKAGSKWQLVIPAGLVYGERDRENSIGPTATLKKKSEVACCAR